MTHPVKLALVLHAHLPYVRASAPFSPHERWLHEAIWECYLPLLQLLEEAGEYQRHEVLTLSISPTLAWMLDDPLLRRRFVGHVEQVRSVNAYQRRSGPQHLAAVRGYYTTLLDEALMQWRSRGGDLLGGLTRLDRQGTIELITTCASHAYLPGWAPLPGAVDAQLALSRAWPRSAPTSAGLWLPEMAFTPALDRRLAQHGVRYCVVDEHALRLATPAVRHGRPAMSETGVLYFPRNSACNERVWSREHGYPSHPVYREFHRDLGFDVPDGQLGELRAGHMTGLKYFRIGGGSHHELPYDPISAQMRAWDDATDFLALVRQLGDHRPDTLIVAAYDAELFGHWWHEGPHFLSALIEQASSDDKIELTTLRRAVATDPQIAVTMPAASSWGRGGFGQTWVGSQTARWWRPMHEVQRLVRHAAQQKQHAGGIGGQALDRAIIEMLLMQASDWLFLQQKGGEDAAYARQRLETHGRNAHQFARMALNPARACLEDIDEANSRPAFLGDIGSARLRRAVVA